MSDDNRPIRKIISCGASSLVTHVTVYEEGFDKISRKHTAVKWDQVETTIENPPLVTSDARYPNAVVLVNPDITTPRRGHQLVIPVKVLEDKTGIMSSAYFKDPKKIGPIVWKPGDKDDGSGSNG